MNTYRIFYKAGTGYNLFNESGRGETLWTMGVAKILDRLGNKLTIYPYGSGLDPAVYSGPDAPSDRTIFARYNDLESVLNTKDFDIAMYLVDELGFVLSSEIGNGRLRHKFFIHGQIGEWDVRNKKYPVNSIVARMHKFHTDIYGHPNFTLARPMGASMGTSKFSNKRIAWTTKYAFSKSGNGNLVPNLANKFLNAMVDAALETNTGITVFNSEMITDCESTIENVKNFNVLETLGKVKDLKFIGNLLPSEYNKELQKCSVVFPIENLFASSMFDSIFFGITPLVFKDSWMMYYPGIKEVSSEMTEGRTTWSYTREEIKNKLIRLLTDEQYYNYFLNKLQPFFSYCLDSEVANQWNNITNYAKSKGFL